MNAFHCTVNVDGVVILLGGGRDTSTHIVIKPCVNFLHSEMKPSSHMPCTLMPLHPSWFGHSDLVGLMKG